MLRGKTQTNAELPTPTTWRETFSKYEVIKPRGISPWNAREELPSQKITKLSIRQPWSYARFSWQPQHAAIFGLASGQRRVNESRDQDTTRPKLLLSRSTVWSKTWPTSRLDARQEGGPRKPDCRKNSRSLQGKTFFRHAYATPRSCRKQTPQRTTSTALITTHPETKRVRNNTLQTDSAPDQTRPDLRFATAQPNGRSDPQHPTTSATDLTKPNTPTKHPSGRTDGRPAAPTQPSAAKHKSNQTPTTPSKDLCHPLKSLSVLGIPNLPRRHLHADVRHNPTTTTRPHNPSRAGSVCETLMMMPRRALQCTARQVGEEIEGARKNDDDDDAQRGGRQLEMEIEMEMEMVMRRGSSNKSSKSTHHMSMDWNPVQKYALSRLRSLLPIYNATRISNSHALAISFRFIIGTPTSRTTTEFHSHARYILKFPFHISTTQLLTSIMFLQNFLHDCWIPFSSSVTGVFPLTSPRSHNFLISPPPANPFSSFIMVSTS